MHTGLHSKRSSSRCNDYGNYVDYADYLAAFSQTRIPVKWPDAIPNLQPRDDIWPTDRAPVIRRLEDGTNEFTELRWGFPPAQPKRPPVINFRSEGRRFPVGRCLVPASFFYEFTGTKSPKSKWKSTKVVVGALLHLSRKHRLSRAPAIALLQDAMPRPGLPLVHFNDTCCSSVAELRSIILKARRLADDHAEQERATAAVKAWLLAQIEKKRARPEANIAKPAPDQPFAPERLAA